MLLLPSSFGFMLGKFYIYDVDKKTLWGILGLIALLSFYVALWLLVKYPALQLILFTSTVVFIGYMRFGNRRIFKTTRTQYFHHYNIFMGALILLVGGSIIWHRYEIQTDISKVLIKGVKANIEVYTIEDEDGDEILQGEFLKPIFPKKYKGGFLYRMDTVLIFFVLIAGFFSLKWGNENLGVESLHS